MTVNISGTTGVSLVQDLTVTTDKIVDSSVTNAKLAYPLTRGAKTAFTAVTATTLINTIPSWATEVTVMLYSFGTSGSSQPVLRLGTVSGPEASGYLGATGGTTGSTGIILSDGFSSSAVLQATVIIRLFDLATNTWVAMGCFSRSDSSGSGAISTTKPLAGALTQLQITTTGAADTMDTTGSYVVWYS